MSWRYKWTLLHTTQKTQILKTSSIRYISSSTTLLLHVSDKTQKSFSQKNDKFILTPQVVHSTLLNCPSDLIALSFFIWCAKQHNYFHNNQVFDHMVGVVTRLTNWYKTVEAIVGELESVGMVTKAQTFLLLLRIYWRGEMYSMVFEAFEQMRSFGFTPNTFALNVIMDVLFKIGQVDAGIKVLKQNQVPNFLSFSIALCNLCKLNDLDNVKDVLRVMLRKGYYPNVGTFEMILNCFCKMGRLTQAYQILDLMITLGISFSVNAWSILIDGLCRLNQPCLAGHVLDKMIESGSSPNIVTYTSLFKGFMKSRMANRAFDVLNTMKSKGNVPDLVVCNVLMDSLIKIGRYDDALDVFLDLPRWKLVPDSYTLSSLLSTISLSRRFNLLPELLSGHAIEADQVVYNSLLNYYCEAGLPFKAVEVYNEMIDKGFTPDRYSFAGLLRGLFGVRRTDEAVNVYRGIILTYSGFDAHLHTIIINGLIQNGKCLSAIRFFRRAIVEKYPLDVVSYTVAIRGLLKGGMPAEAFMLYNQMKEVGLSPNTHTYNIMLHGFFKERDIKMVKKLLQEIIEAGVQLDCKTIIRITNFILRSHSSSLTHRQLTKLWNLARMPDEAMNALLFHGIPSGVKVGDASSLLLQGYLEDNTLVDASSSDDLSDVAASVG